MNKLNNSKQIEMLVEFSEWVIETVTCEDRLWSMSDIPENINTINKLYNYWIENVYNG